MVAIVNEVAFVVVTGATAVVILDGNPSMEKLALPFKPFIPVIVIVPFADPPGNRVKTACDG